MPRGVEVVILSGTNALLERREYLLREGIYSLLFVGMANVSDLNDVSDRSKICAFNIRGHSEVMDVVATDVERLVDKPAEALIGRARLLPPEDLVKIENDLMAMGIKVRFYEE